MEQIAPYPEMFLLPEGSKTTVIAANQPQQYEPLTSIITPDGKVVSQWKPDTDELKKLVAGEPLTLIVWTFNHPLQPIFLGVGGFDLTK